MDKFSLTKYIMSEITFNTRQEFKQFIQTNQYVVVRVSATWCGPCKRIHKQVAQFTRNLPSHVKRVFVDYDAHRDVAKGLRIKSVPTFILIIGGQPNICLVGSDITKVTNFYKGVVSRV